MAPLQGEIDGPEYIQASEAVAVILSAFAEFFDRTKDEVLEKRRSADAAFALMNFSCKHFQ